MGTYAHRIGGGIDLGYRGDMGYVTHIGGGRNCPALAPVTFTVMDGRGEQDLCRFLVHAEHEEGIPLLVPGHGVRKFAAEVQLFGGIGRGLQGLKIFPE